MAKLGFKSQPSLISTLTRERAGIIRQAGKREDEDLTVSDTDRLDAINILIANAVAQNRADAAEQVAVACELVELCWDGVGGEQQLDAAYAALRSAKAVLLEKKRTA